MHLSCISQLVELYYEGAFLILWNFMNYISSWLFECFRNVSWKFKRLIIEIDFVIEQVFKNYFFPLWIYKCMHSHSRMRSSFQCCNIGYFLLATFYFFWRFNVFYFRWILNIIRKYVKAYQNMAKHGNSRVFQLRQLWIVNYYVKSSSNNLSNENIKTGVSREMIFQK